MRARIDALRGISVLVAVRCRAASKGTEAWLVRDTHFLAAKPHLRAFRHQVMSCQ